MTALLELRDVEARYGPVQALHGVSLAVEEGRIVAVLGANGAGKTTTLRAISNTVHRSGRRALRGAAARPARPGGGRPARDRARPEGRGTFAELTRLGEPPPRRLHAPRLDPKADLARVLSYFPWLDDRRHQQAGTLSGGEQQMLALARAFMQRPRLLLLDEPSLGLAPVLVTEIFRIIRELNEKRGADGPRRRAERAPRAPGLPRGVRARGRPRRARRPERGAARARVRPPELPRLLMATVETAADPCRPRPRAARNRLRRSRSSSSRRPSSSSSARCGARSSPSRPSPASRRAPSTAASRSRSSSSTARPR